MREIKYQAGVIDPLNKALGRMKAPIAPDAAGQTGWNLLREELSLPAAVLYEDRLAHNLEWMRRFMNEYGVQLAPHGKTTMAPKLFARQLAPARGASRWPPRTRPRPRMRTASSAC